MKQRPQRSLRANPVPAAERETYFSSTCCKRNRCCESLRSRTIVVNPHRRSTRYRDPQRNRTGAPWAYLHLEAKGNKRAHKTGSASSDGINR